MVILSVLANDCQNSASISLCCRFSLAFLRRRAFLEDDSSRKSTFFGFDVFFFVLIFVSSTVNIVCINKTVLSMGDTYQNRIYFKPWAGQKNDKCIRGAFSYFNGDVTKPDIGCVHNKPIWEKMVGSCRQ
jgi:hypothetical protein